MTSRKDTHLVYMDNEGHVWMQEYSNGDKHPDNAEFYSEVPTNDDKRWIDGKPSQVNQEFLTLCPFYPSQRLDVSVEIKREPQLMNVNHPAFEGCVKYMKISSLNLRPIPKHIERNIYEIGVCHYGHKTAYKTADIPADSQEEALRKGRSQLQPSIVESLVVVGVKSNEFYNSYYEKKPKLKP